MLLCAKFPFYRCRRLQAPPIDNEYKIIAITKRKEVDCTVSCKNGKVNDDTASYHEKHNLENKSIQNICTKYVER